MLNIILFGSPGSGKGTQSKNIINKYRLTHLSTGDILRAEITRGTPLGLAAQSFIDQGELVPDEVVIGMIREILLQCNRCTGFIFDGFPRTIFQAESLDAILKEKDAAITMLFELQVDNKELMKRLINRGKIGHRTDDSDVEIIKKRIRFYHEYTKSVIEYYRAQDKFQPLNGMGSIDDVFSQICNVVETQKKA
jgi:adenylate kinase